MTEPKKGRWMRFVDALGRVQTAILLVLIYVIVLGPVSLLLRAAGKGDLLALKGAVGASTWTVKKPIPTDAHRCERQF